MIIDTTDDGYFDGIINTKVNENSSVDITVTADNGNNTSTAIVTVPSTADITKIAVDTAKAEVNVDLRANDTVKTVTGNYWTNVSVDNLKGYTITNVNISIGYSDENTTLTLSDTDIDSDKLPNTLTTLGSVLKNEWTLHNHAGRI